jgi:excisionase family DNA binding protein
MESMMTVRQVAELLGVHENWVYDQAASGQLPSYKIGGTRRFDPDEVRGWIADHREPERRREPRQRIIEKRTAAGGARRPVQDGEHKSTAAPPPRERVDGSQPRLFD